MNVHESINSADKIHTMPSDQASKHERSDLAGTYFQVGLLVLTFKVNVTQRCMNPYCHCEWDQDSTQARQRQRQQNHKFAIPLMATLCEQLLIICRLYLQVKEFQLVFVLRGAPADPAPRPLTRRRSPEEPDLFSYKWSLRW